MLVSLSFWAVRQVLPTIVSSPVESSYPSKERPALFGASPGWQMVLCC
jgi:hypothetical protein